MLLLFLATAVGGAFFLSEAVADAQISKFDIEANAIGVAGVLTFALYRSRRSKPPSK